MKKAYQFVLAVVCLLLSATPAAFSKAAADTAKIMPLGDSITELNWQGGYRSQLYKMLRDASCTFDFVGTKTTNHDGTNLGFVFPQAYWDHEGYTSATIGVVGSTWLWNLQLRGKLAANPPTIILIMLGMNDIANGTRTSVQIRNTMSAFLDSVWAFNPGIKVILSNVTRVFPGTLYKAALLDSINRYNALLPALVASKVQAGRYCVLVDNYSAMTVASDVEDGVHPSVTGYPKIAAIWFPAVVKAITSGGTVSVTEVVPASRALVQNYPNPFNPSTTIRYSIPSRSFMKLSVFDVLGREVALLVNGEEETGNREIRFDGAGLASGVYFVRLTAGNSTAIQKVILEK